MRKANLEQLLAQRTDGITAATFERGDIGRGLFRAVCRMGLEGLFPSIAIGRTAAAGRNTGSK
ncbi:hypothetical protein [Bradyrhizobium sp. Rc2d]|uniref:hypothetical protein n=1 Tax=Bradyrhizobium sp. Rc2d TaxID=1855321 RepID=UPI001AECC433|nr:hypothetical protein [Bradyrhizobium sp. Rc2d]